MSNSVPVSFIQLYDAEVKTAYQREGAFLRNTVFARTKVGAERIWFPKLGQGEVTDKARHAEVPLMNLAHERAFADMVPKYAADMLDDVDEIRTNQDLRSSYARTAAWAVGRFVDQQIIDAVMTSPNSLDATTINTAAGFTPVTAMSLHVIAAANQFLNDNDVPPDNMRFAVVSPETLADLQQYVEGFSSSDFVTQRPLMNGKLLNFWMGFNWIMHTGLPAGVKGIFYHKRAVGHGTAKDITSRIDWVPRAVAWQILSYGMFGATIIDNDGTLIITDAP